MGPPGTGGPLEMEKQKKSLLMFVLVTEHHTYFVEYLFNELILSNSITEAMLFDNIDTAHRFKTMLYSCCDLKCSINTFIK